MNDLYDRESELLKAEAYSWFSSQQKPKDFSQEEFSRSLLLTKIFSGILAAALTIVVAFLVF